MRFSRPGSPKPLFSHDLAFYFSLTWCRDAGLLVSLHCLSAGFRLQGCSGSQSWLWLRGCPWYPDRGVECGQVATCRGRCPGCPPLSINSPLTCGSGVAANSLIYVTEGSAYKLEAAIVLSWLSDRCRVIVVHGYLGDIHVRSARSSPSLGQI